MRRRSLARLRQEVEPVEPAVLGRFLVNWHGIGRRRRGLDALLDVVEQLQGVPLVASTLERHVLPARIDAYDPSLLDTLISAGEVLWLGVEPLGERDGRIALYLTDHAKALLPSAGGGSATSSAVPMSLPERSPCSAATRSSGHSPHQSSRPSLGEPIGSSSPPATRSSARASAARRSMCWLPAPCG